MQLPTHAAIESATNIANITADDNGSGATEFLQMLISGPALNVVGARDWTQLMFNSANAGSTSSASLTGVYIGSNGVPHFYAVMDITGFNISPGSIVAAHPGTTPVVPETWQNIPLINSYGSGTNNGFIDVPQVRLMADNKSLQFKGTLACPAAGSALNWGQIPAGYPNANLGGIFGMIQCANISGGTLDHIALNNNGVLSLMNIPNSLNFEIYRVIDQQ
jgi:hypothetical protein